MAGRQPAPGPANTVRAILMRYCVHTAAPGMRNVICPAGSGRATPIPPALGRTITYRELSFDENKDAMIRAGVPETIAEMNAQAFSMTAEGDAEWITGDVPSLLGLPARSFEQFAADHAAAFS